MADLELLNNLYNILDLYLVTSRLEGGPQAILESAITKTQLFQLMSVLHLRFYIMILFLSQNFIKTLNQIQNMLFKKVMNI